MTLLEMTQNILSAMNSDEVNSITDTVESQQVAEEIKTTFFELYNNRDIAEQQGLVHLNTLSDSLRPNVLTIPSGVDRLKWVKYLNVRSGNAANYEIVKYLDPEDFLRRVVELSTSAYALYSVVQLTPNTELEYTISAEKAPSFYTVFDNENELIFDSYDIALEPYLSSGNSLAWGYYAPTFQLQDDFVPGIDSHLFPHFLAEAKSACFINIKEVANSKEEARARRQLVRSQFRTDKTNGQRKGIFSGIDYSKRRR